MDGNDEVQADAESVASFFSATCAAGSNDDGPAVGGGAWEGMCTACKGDCSSSDPFFDYSGSVRCLMEGAGEGLLHTDQAPDARVIRSNAGQPAATLPAQGRPHPS